MATYDIPALERALENTERNDAEAHKLFNNLGLAHAANRHYRQALRAHREEKRACKRLVAATARPTPPALLLDLAIAYRLCGDVMLKLDKLLDARNNLLQRRADIIRVANDQHARGLAIARSVRSAGVPARVELQAACAALAQSALALALETKDLLHYRQAAFACVEAALYATQLPVGTSGVPSAARDSMLLGISVNMAIALSGLKLRDNAKKLLYRVAINARKAGDDKNLVRAVSNLAEEAGLDGDWELSVKFVREWIRLAQKHDDQADEADALRMLGSALRETGDLEEAKSALERSLQQAGTKAARDEAIKFLDVVNADIENLSHAAVEFADLNQKVESLENDAAFVEEAKLRLKAGEIAHLLHRHSDVVRHLGRYFVLVDEYGCNTGVTEVPEGSHNTAVANLAESMWNLKRFGEAVKWGTKEVTVYGDDIAGQAQAWCNLGVYLDDFGKKESAIEALRKSISLAEESNERDTLRRARGNLDLVEALSQSDEEEYVAGGKDGAESPVSPGQAITEVIGPSMAALTSNRDDSRTEKESRPRTFFTSPPPQNALGNDEKSIIIDSTQPLGQTRIVITDCSQGPTSKRSRQGRKNIPTSSVENIGPCFVSRVEPPRSHPSAGLTTGDRSSVGVRKFVDLAAQYKALCSKRQHPAVSPRAMVASALRSLSSTLLAHGACDEPSNTLAKLDVSALFLTHHDVSLIFETLTQLGGEHHILLDLRLNPLLTPAAYDCLDPRSFVSPGSLPSLRKLDLSCSSVSSSTLRVLGDALSEQGALHNLTHLNVSKNGLGRHCRSTANAVAYLILGAARLEVLDLSLNLLQRTFLPTFIDALEAQYQLSSRGKKHCGLRSFDLHLNNRKAPSALLDVPSPGRVVQTIARLFQLLPALECVDVRACGASPDMRHQLRELAAGFECFSQNIVTVSPAIHDDV